MFMKQYKYLNSLLSDMIGTVTKFAMQSDIDADYIMRLGASPELVTVTGNNYQSVGGAFKSNNLTSGITYVLSL